MIKFKPMSIMDRILCILPSHKEQIKKDTREAIEYLIRHPEEPCVVGDYLVPDGYGTPESKIYHF